MWGRCDRMGGTVRGGRCGVDGFDGLGVGGVSVVS